LTGNIIETLDSPELLMEDQVWLDYLWDFEMRGIDLDPSLMISSCYDLITQVATLGLRLEDELGIREREYIIH